MGTSTLLLVISLLSFHNGKSQDYDSRMDMFENRQVRMRSEIGELSDASHFMTSQIEEVTRIFSEMSRKNKNTEKIFLYVEDYIHLRRWWLRDIHEELENVMEKLDGLLEARRQDV